MDISVVKDLLKKLSFLKDYSALLMPIIIVIVAALLFIPVHLMNRKLRKDVEKASVSIGRDVRFLSEDTVSINQGREMEKYQLEFANDANRISLLAKQSTQRELLSYTIFPEPKETSRLIFEEFGQEFRKKVEGLIESVNARDCPTRAEMQESMQRGPSPAAAGGAWGMLDFMPMSGVEGFGGTITEIICREKAESASVYASLDAITGYKFWEKYNYTGIDDAVKDCWYYQLGYWIIEDIFKTVGNMNDGSETVFTSPVKRIVNIRFNVGFTDFRISGSVKSAGGRPRYVLSVNEGLATPWTARYTNDDIDVVHFNVVVVISAKDILPFIKELCSDKESKFRGFQRQGSEQTFRHNQITVLEYDISSINRGMDTGQYDEQREMMFDAGIDGLQGETHRLHRYGDDAVVRLDLICEYIFNKNGYEEIKPESVKKESVKQADTMGIPY